MDLWIEFYFALSEKWVVAVMEKSVNREKHEKDKMTEDSNTHGSEES
jgi:hypothetical protein